MLKMAMLSRPPSVFLIRRGKEQREERDKNCVPAVFKNSILRTAMPFSYFHNIGKIQSSGQTEKEGQDHFQIFMCPIEIKGE